MDTPVYQAIRPYLARFRRRLRQRSALGFLQRTSWMACLAGALILLSGRLLPLEGTRPLALAPLAVWGAASLGILLFKPLADLRVALSADRELDLKERVSTCLAFNAEGSPLAGRSFDAQLVQQMNADALAALSRVDMRRSFPPRFKSRPLMAAGLLLVGALLLAFLPNPMDQVLAERRAVAQAARQQAEKIADLKKEVEKTADLTPEEKERLLQRLAELARQLQANPGDRQQALADIDRVEQAIRQQLDPGAAMQKAALEGIAARLQALAGAHKDERLGDLQKAAEDLKALAEQIGQMTPEQRSQLARDLGQLAARASQAGDSATAQALAALAQAALSGDSQSAGQAAQAGQQALQQAQTNLANQQALQRALAGVQASQQAMAQAGAAGQNASQGQGGQNSGQGQGQGQGQQAGRPGSGGGSNANTLPGSQGQGAFNRPSTSKPALGEGALPAGDIFVPREKRPAGGNELFVPGQDTGQGEEQVRPSQSTLPGASSPSLIPYQSVYQSYLDTASQALDQSAIPLDLKDFVRDYFSQLEP